MKIFFTTMSILMLFTAPALSDRLVPGNRVPEFEVQDVYGNQITHRLVPGKKTLITFLRSAGCPICNLYVHELLQKQDMLASAGIHVVLVYESSRENLLQYLEGERLPFTFIADPRDTLYKQFFIERSFMKLMKANFHGGMTKMRTGKKLFKTSSRPTPKQDGNLTTVGADFLIDESGKVMMAHYGNYVGDHVSVAKIVEMAAPQQTKAPDFEATTIAGESFRLSSLKGEKILLSFYRNGACALCNLRVHELNERRAELEAAGITVVCVFESSVEDMKPYVGKQAVPFVLLADPQGELYKLYGIENSEQILNQVMAAGTASKKVEEAARAGFPLTPQPGSNFFRIPADVLIDRDFTIHTIHHCNELINHLPIERILKFGRQ